MDLLCIPPTRSKSTISKKIRWRRNRFKEMKEWRTNTEIQMNLIM